MTENNQMEVIFDARSENEGFARVVIAAFLAQKNPTMDELADVKTAVSEAVTNSIIHGYEAVRGKVRMSCTLSGDCVEICVEDKGRGIADIARAMQPFYTTKPQEERSGMGFAFMEAFMDEVRVESKPQVGTTVFMKKILGSPKEEDICQPI